ncbi:DUF397 domain-containing protein [Streptomyces sp. KR80]|uniref:DUF397 domain-containing protein n=1 Tax=Streptomyces sp. KR80 TaxID=3457426 RepID=UPI003FD2947B
MNTLQWFKSSFSDSGGGDCVEIAIQPGEAVHIRDSKNPSGPSLTFAPTEWSAFVAFASAHVEPHEA